jgi:hypothetical protein
VQLPPIRQCEPDAAAGRERRGFLQFVQAQQAGVEPAGIALSSGGHRQLDVI